MDSPVSGGRIVKMFRRVFSHGKVPTVSLSRNSPPLWRGENKPVFFDPVPPFEIDWGTGRSQRADRS